MFLFFLQSVLLGVAYASRNIGITSNIFVTPSQYCTTSERPSPPQKKTCSFWVDMATPPFFGPNSCHSTLAAGLLVARLSGSCSGSGVHLQVGSFKLLKSLWKDVGYTGTLLYSFYTQQSIAIRQFIPYNI